MTRQVTLYGRPGCCLCDEARAVIERVRRRLPFDLQEQNIESDDGLLGRYLERIPVIAIDGRDHFELFLDEAAFERALRAPREA
ncbi:MAG TPA: glutaredoxin family protein [Solirubrobacteraceae bacterium]|nr:glutaredoxin family protein [Solirubrobacteraceae bacterium]